MTDTTKATAGDLSNKASEGYEYAKSTGSDAASKVGETASNLKNKAYGNAESPTGKTEETADAAAGKSKGAYEVTKEKLNS